MKDAFCRCFVTSTGPRRRAASERSSQRQGADFGLAAAGERKHLPRLEVVAVCLLGCETAVSPSGKRTLRLLARTLGIPVFGAIKPLMKSHYSKLGFDPAFACVLVEASELVQAIPARTS